MLEVAGPDIVLAATIPHLTEARALSDYWSDWSVLGVDYVGGCCEVDAFDLQELAAGVA